MKLNRFFRRRHWDEERVRELATYLEFETAENISRGMDCRRSPRSRSS